MRDILIVKAYISTKEVQLFDLRHFQEVKNKILLRRC